MPDCSYLLLRTLLRHPAKQCACASLHLKLKPGHWLASHANQWLKDSTLKCNSSRHPVMQGSFAWNWLVSKCVNLFIIRETAAEEPLSSVYTCWIRSQRQESPSQVVLPPPSNAESLTFQQCCENYGFSGNSGLLYSWVLSWVLKCSRT